MGTRIVSGVRNWSVGLGVAAGLACVSASAQDSAAPVVVTSPIEQVFVPYGFDDNDNVEVVLSGTFSNSCYKAGLASAQVDKNTNEIHIHAESFLYSSTDPTACLKMLVPFQQVVQLGVLPEGSYRILVDGKPNLASAPLKVEKAPGDGRVDNFLYAPVDEVSFSQDARNPEKKTFTVSGRYPYMFRGCMVMNRVESYVSGNVLVILPVTDVVDGDQCAASQYDYKFQVTAPVKGSMVAGKYLVHVRTLNGNAVNRVVDVTDVVLPQ